MSVSVASFVNTSTPPPEGPDFWTPQAPHAGGMVQRHDGLDDGAVVVWLLGKAQLEPDGELGAKETPLGHFFVTPPGGRPRVSWGWWGFLLRHPLAISALLDHRRVAR